jgi:hypothetical protein
MSILVLSLAFYSCLRTYKSELKLTTQLLPLLINTASSLILVGLYSQMEVYNTRLILLVVEVYSYFILTYGFVSMVMRSKPSLMRRLKYFSRDAGR